MTVITADTRSDFDKHVLQSDRPVVVDFWAPWCGPCRKVGPELDALAAQYGDRLRVVKVNVDENQSAAQEYKIMSIPAIGLFEKGKLVKMTVGAKPRQAIEADLELPKRAAAKPEPTSKAPAAARDIVEKGPRPKPAADGKY